MINRCQTTRYTTSVADLPRLARQLGYERLARHIAGYPRGMAGRRFARLLSAMAASSRHIPHATGGPCRRTARVGSASVMLLTVPRGTMHQIRSARRLPRAAVGIAVASVPEEEALLDNLVG
jgi:hypothetical protein